MAVRIHPALAGPAFAAALVGSNPAVAQAIPQKMQSQAVETPVPGNRFNPPPGAVVDDPNRVFGDEAPFFAPLAIVGALGITPNASVTIAYDDNVARLDDGEVLPPRFQSRADWIIRPNFGLGAERNVGRHRLFANASIGRIIYAQNTNLNANRFSLGGGAGLYLGRLCSGSLTVGYSKRDWLIGDFEDAANATVETTNFGAGVNCATSAGLTGSVNYGRGSRRNFSNEPGFDRSVADSDFQSLGGSLGYRVGLRGQVGVNANWSENRFPNQFVLGEENTNTINSFGVFASYRIGSTLIANGSIGQTRVRSNVPGSQTFEGGNWNIGVSYAGNRVGGNLSMGQSINGGGGNQAANFAVARIFNASMTYRVNDRMGASAGYNRSQQDFKGNFLVPESQRVQSFNGDRFFAGLNYSFVRFLSARADISYNQRRSQPVGAGFDSTVASLTLVANF